MSNGVIIYGMHRSGTSLVANWFVKSGFSIGDGPIMGAAEDNPNGFYERLDVVELNDQILESKGICWCDVLVNSPRISLDSELQVRQREICEGFNQTDNWVLKDPRINFLSDIWEEQLDDFLRVIVMREPLSVAQSLAKRNSFPIDYGLNLNSSYIRSISDLYDKQNTYVVYYDELLKDASDEFSQLADFLESNGFTCQFIEGDEVVEPRLNHSFNNADSEESNTNRYSAAYKAFKNKKDPLVFPIEEQEAEMTELVRSSISGEHYRRLATDTQKEVEHERKNNAILTSQVERSNGLLKDAKAKLYEMEVVSERLYELSSIYAEAHPEDQSDMDLRVWSRQVISRSIQYVDITKVLSMYLSSRVGRTAIFINKLLGKVKGGAAGDSSIEYLEHQLVGMKLLPQKKGKSSRVEFIKSQAISVYRHPIQSLKKVNSRNVRRLYQILLKGGDPRNSHLTQGDYESLDLDKTELGDAQPSELSFNTVDDPEVSIIIPVFNHLQDTIRCLASIKRNSGQRTYEILIADDQSTDGSFEEISSIEGVKGIRIGTNSGFVKNCNYAAGFAGGKYILFLNNDTEVQQGWLDSLVDAMELDDTAGVAGSRLVYPNASLQEAGGIIFSDANGWNYGRNDNPNKPQYLFKRYVDYVSGAALLTRRDLWNELGGFDVRFAPAYYEDTDYCFSVRNAGLNVVYVPESTIIHYEGVSNGTDVAGEGLKQYQVINKEKFKHKWSNFLSEHQYPGPEKLALARISGEKRHILVYDHYIPMHDRDAGSRSTRIYLEAFVKSGYHVTFIGENLHPHQPYTRELQELGIEVLYGAIHPEGIVGWFEENLRNYEVLYTHRPHVTEKFVKLFKEQREKWGFKWVYFGHDLHFLRAIRDFAAGVAEVDDSERWKTIEGEILNCCDLALYPSIVECDLIQSEFPNVNVDRLPLMFFDVKDHRSEAAAESKKLVFVGGFGHPPNLKGLEWFLEYCWTSILKTVPDAQLYVIGSKMPGKLEKLNVPNANFLGQVSEESLKQHYRASAIAIVPLLSGAGIKGKVLEAMSYGVPVWSTSVGAEGINVSKDKYVIVSDDPKEISNDICRLLLERDINVQTGLDCLHYIKNNYSERLITEKINEFF